MECQNNVESEIGRQPWLIDESWLQALMAVILVRERTAIFDLKRARIGPSFRAEFKKDWLGHWRNEKPGQG
jgi:hypothetical protein